jgi:hypothetical protein
VARFYHFTGLAASVRKKTRSGNRASFMRPFLRCMIEADHHGDTDGAPAAH